MLTHYQSQTIPINPPGSTPILSIEKLWSAMLVKCRSPELFVAPISSCEVLEDTPTFIKRKVFFKEGMSPPGGEAIEDLQIRAPWKVDFYNRTTGSFINNTISQGKDDKDLYLTFYFEWIYPNLEEGSQEAKETNEKLWGMARTTVQHTIDLARKMLREGKLEG